MLKWPLFLLLMLVSTLSYADRISKLEIDIYLNSDRSVDVKEVYSFKPHYQIKHGLYRFLPVRYYKNANDVYGTPLEIKNILVNGLASPYHTKEVIDYEATLIEQYNKSENKAVGFDVIYIGSENVLLPEGYLHTTTIDYSVKNIILDENGESRFSWNIQGFGWDMERDSVTARFHFPEGANAHDIAFFIGSIRSSDTLGSQHYVYNQETNVVTLFYKRMVDGQDITIDSYFPIETFHETSGSFENVFFSYKAEIIIWVTFIVSFLVWFFIWLKVGRDPKGLIRMTRYASPDGISPAECRYFRIGAVDKRTSISMIVDAAIKRYIQIDKRNETAPMILSKKESFSKAPKGTKSAFSSLFGKKDELKVRQSNTVASRFDYFSKRLKKQIIKKHPNQFQNNIGHFMIGLLFVIPGFLWAIFNVPEDSFRNIFLFGAAPLILSAITVFGIELYLEETVNKSKFLIIGTGVISIVAFIYFIPKFFFISSASLFGFVAICLSINFWRYLMKNRTAFSREMEDKIMGYEHYLRSTEERYLDFLNEPETAPVLFEKHLPYAIALDCESRWSDAFERYILDVKNVDYQPVWFHSSLTYHWIGYHMCSNISSNSVAPPSTSGSSSYSGGGFGGGGGFSGGGFGGGGGGGW